MNAIAYLPAPQIEETATPAPVQIIPAATVTRSSLVAAIATACAVVEKRNTIPILGNVLLRDIGDGLEVIGTNLDIWTRAVVAGEVSPGFAVTVPAHDLRDMLKAATSDDVTFTQISPERVAITLGGVTASLLTIPPESDFPECLKFQTPAMGYHGEPLPLYNFPIEAGEFSKALDYVTPAISTEETRYYLNGIYMHFRADTLHGLRGLCMVATDGHRLHARSVPSLVPTNLPGFIVPRLAIKVIGKQLGKKPKGQIRLKVQPGANLIRFTLPDGVEFTSKLVDGTFPDYERVTPRAERDRVTVNAAALAGAIKQAGTVSREKARAIRFTTEEGKITCEVNNPDSGSSSVSVPATVPEDCRLVAGFNAVYMLDCLQRIDGAAHWQLVEAGSPALMIAPNDPRGLMVLMPMRV